MQAAHENPDFNKNQVSHAENRRWPRDDSAATLDSFLRWLLGGRRTRHNTCFAKGGAQGHTEGQPRQTSRHPGTAR
jgi:hypothetical protein